MKRFFVFLINWFSILTMPIWAGFFLWGVIIYESVKDKGGTRRILTGKQWILD